MINLASQIGPRRDFLKAGAITALGLGLDSYFRLSRFSNLRAGHSLVAPKAKSCILIWLDGGPSHLETFDLKPDAPADVRGPFQSIRSAVPGIDLCELMPLTAKVTSKIALIRSMTSPLGEHGLANQYLLTGYKPSPVLNYPSYGSVVARLRDPVGSLPPYVAIPESRQPAGAGFLGNSFQPFVTGGDPGRAGFKVKDLDYFPGINAARMGRRREFLAKLDQFQMQKRTGAERREGEGKDKEADVDFDQAFRLASSAEAKKAFDLSAESEATRARYGPRTLGQSCLLARRLVERGVPFATAFHSGWDTHDNLVRQLKEGYAGAKVGVGLVPTLDQAFSALIEDLDQRGLLQETLVIAMGEFGRTPKLNARGGRDHWPRVFSLALAGGGVRGGQVIGASDRVGESPRDQPVSPNDLARTIYSLLGIDPDHELQTADGRPVSVNQGGKVIAGLV